MQLNWIDWVFIVGYCVVAFGVGVYFSKRASRDMSEFFVAGRNLPWWLAGTSIVATTFAADTPLAVSGLARGGGIYSNWFWWNGVMGGMLCVFFYARLWRRAGVITDVEFIELRYSGRQASVLRGFMAVYGGVLQNCIVMGWVMLAMTKICDVLLGWPKVTTIIVLMVITLAYTVMSGFWGVVMTDLVQFIMAMTGSIALAGIVLYNLGGPAGMVERIQASPDFKPELFHMTPDLATAGKLALITFIVQMALQWWGGGQGGGYLAQRLFATKNETHSALAALWFNFAHYVLRPWPWLIVGLGSVVYFSNADLFDPALAEPDFEKAYPLMIARFLPVGLRGLMVASLLAAFMSTMDTQLNWGASYLVNDLYRRFIRRDANERHYVNVSRVAMLVLMGLGALTAWQSKTIGGAWIYLAKLTAGAGFVGLLRWYWWRVNAWSEISALLGSLVIANADLVAKLLDKAGLMPEVWMERITWLYSKEAYALLFAIIVVACTAIWLVVTFITEPVQREHLDRFYRRVRPGGWWGPMAVRCPDVAGTPAARGWVGCVAGTVCIYAGLFGVGYLCLARIALGLVFLAVCAVSGWLMVSQASLGEGGTENA
ncbi:MAG TPA: Na+:solute symporter [Candidatus Hydrogenedentes bacterium]|nr:Na+:solute symporter [Candidatus Hydrogenedentota bacterium]HPG68418.1 Na+:solute symporter [Candidatus Hydrogenedentota bacterium]